MREALAKEGYKTQAVVAWHGRRNGRGGGSQIEMQLRVTRIWGILEKVMWGWPLVGSATRRSQIGRSARV
jgi:hypothetical protein